MRRIWNPRVENGEVSCPPATRSVQAVYRGTREECEAALAMRAGAHPVVHTQASLQSTLIAVDKKSATKHPGIHREELLCVAPAVIPDKTTDRSFELKWKGETMEEAQVLLAI